VSIKLDEIEVSLASGVEGEEVGEAEVFFFPGENLSVVV
jgi:hypothetical protein